MFGRAWGPILLRSARTRDMRSSIEDSVGLWLDPGDLRQAYHSFAEEIRNGFIMFKYPVNDANRRHPAASTGTSENTGMMLKPLTDELQLSTNRWKSELSRNRNHPYLRHLGQRDVAI